MRKSFVCILAVAFLAAGYAQGQAISAIQARDIALIITEGGVVSSVDQVSDPAVGLAFQVVVTNNNVRYEVFINASTGDIFRLTTAQTAAAPPPADGSGRAITSQGIDLTALGITPAPPPHWFRLTRPRNPPVSRENAVKIGYLFLASRGFPHANFRRHQFFAERDYGRWAWQLYFMDGWREIELYIDMHSGEVVIFDIDW
ncbi:MAG: PepSY domain-containing protein [Treponema sp.]|nr:PepSY domain-containing protein [Treponema sp.]